MLGGCSYELCKIGDESWSWSGWLYAICASEDTEYDRRILELSV